MMKYVFFGTPEFAAIILKKLVDSGFSPLAVVCNPDRPVGRKKIIMPPAVKTRIMNYELGTKDKIKILQPEKLDENFHNSLFMIRDSFDLFIVAAYAKIIPEEMLKIPRLGVIGIHPSLLPKYRGATPIQTAILNGENKTGVTLYLLDEKVDHGPILAQQELTMTNDDNYDTLSKKLAELGADLLIEFFKKLAQYYEVQPPRELTSIFGRLNLGEVGLPNIELQPQNEAEATYTKKFKTEDAYVDLTKDDPIIIERKVRALNPEPGVWTYAKTLRQYWEVRPPKIDVNIGRSNLHEYTRVKILEAEIIDGKLILKKIQFEGKKPTLLNK